MPRLNAAAAAAVCEAHGKRCRAGGSGTYVSAQCRKIVTPATDQAALSGTLVTIREARLRAAVARGASDEEAERAVNEQERREVAEDRIERARWAKLPLTTIDAEIVAARATGYFAEVDPHTAVVLVSARNTAAADLAAAKVVEDAERVIDAAADQQNRHHSPQDRLTLVPGTSDTPAPIRARPRRPRRARGPRLTVIQTVYDDDEETLGHDDRF